MEQIRTRSAGGVVIGDGGVIAMVRSRNADDAWLFPKGHVEDNETDEDAARREIEEETSLTDLEYLDDLGEYMRPRIMKDGGDDPHEMKTIHMFLFSAPKNTVLKAAHEIIDARWVPFQNVGALIGNKTDRFWFAGVVPRVREAIQRD